MHKNTFAGKIMIRLFVVTALSMLFACIVWAGDDPRTLLKASETRHRSLTQQYSGDLTVVNKAGKVRKKGWKSFREGYAGDAKTLIRFTSPPEVSGVGFLSIAHAAGKNPDQWLYLPSMKRERRIAAQDRDTAFVGTNFSYEDMEEFDNEKYEVSLKGDETVAGQPCYVIEATPLETGIKSVYEKRRLYLRKDILYMVRVDLFRKGDKEPSKRLTLSDIQEISGHWVAKTMEMSDTQKGSKTTIVLKEIAFDTPKVPERFTLQNLNREGGD